ncbi:hypothetical protein AmaxDRAFT_1975 [Limnospira maxima CS-328]|uniref:Uncharacterized protein n=3 Tax=Limnospira TaxID=2596745 RepID=B5VZH3_LIMMA|nr:hypothetical protein AmaxDRAFT_1975 [Limnospira maxima CS-328]
MENRFLSASSTVYIIFSRPDSIDIAQTFNGYRDLKSLKIKPRKIMKNTTQFQEIAAEVQLFNDIEQKEKFVFVVGALVSRLISLQKGAEIMEMEPEMLLKILEMMGIEFSYLTPEDIKAEKTW